MTKVIRWGIIGCGDVTEVKSGPAYQQTKGFSISAVMRRNPEKVADYAKRHKIPKYYTNADDLINDAEVDAVYIATPPDSHKLYALKVAEARKICCIEKPMAPSYNDCVLITKAFADKKLPLFVAYYRRTLPRFLKVKEWIDKGLIGEPNHISWVFSKPANATDLSGAYNWRTDAKIAPGGYFDDLASHGLDFFNYILGNITAANGIAINKYKFYSAKDNITASWLHPNGVVGSGTWCFGSKEAQDEVTIYGSKGRIEFSIFQLKPFQLITDSHTEINEIAHPKHIQHYHVEAMRDQLSDLGMHPCNGEEGAHTAWVMDQILAD
ncbi:Gfo/Idh/MocA family protein [Saccharicrinis aurantiacus]|uniref:Gfo/Idh/MocA family protein n=1 Tax=Saccharicrinis aurantiacus TaxID=1849719 RepID=UPI000838A1EF|nr:Gfo/Idh/MocA family oxidoreductase [Saccharicrinis aurantiacus]